MKKNETKISSCVFDDLSKRFYYDLRNDWKLILWLLISLSIFKCFFQSFSNGNFLCKLPNNVFTVKFRHIFVFSFDLKIVLESFETSLLLPFNKKPINYSNYLWKFVKKLFKENLCFSTFQGQLRPTKKSTNSIDILNFI